MARGTPSSLFTSHSLLKGVFFSFILTLCFSGLICSAVRENRLRLVHRQYSWYEIEDSVRHLAVATLILSCLSFVLALVAVGCFAAVPILRHMKGNWKDGCILLAIGTLLLWLVSIVLAGVQLSKPSYDVPSRGVGIASGVVLLLAGLLLALTFACIYFGLRRVRAKEGQELQGLGQQSAMPHTGGRIKDLYSEDEPAADSRPIRPKQTRSSGDAHSGDAFSWQQQSNPQSDTWQQTSGSQHNSWQHQSDSWQQKDARGGAHQRASAPPAPPAAPYGVTVLSLGEVYAATDGFSANNFLGQGGFGQVYKGVLPNAKTVAVKRLQLHLPGSARETIPGERDFQAEATIIARVHHRHLVQLVGFCTTAQERILVLEYMPNGSLADNLYGDKATLLTWPQRLSIAIGAAKGLAYLHEDCQPRIIHRDIKASNILLDAGFGAKIADFGFARFAREFQSMTTATRTVGTFHYLPPECTMYGEKNTDKSDVYSFGVVLLEILSGRPPVDPGQPRERVALIPWARQLKQIGNERFIVDERLGKSYASHEVARVFECAIACLNERPEMRPSMGVVLRMLEGHVAEPPQAPPVDRQHSTIYGRDTDVSMVIPITIHEGR